MRFAGTTNELLELIELGRSDGALLSAPFPNGLRVIWNTGDGLVVRVDGQSLALQRDQLLFLTEHHRMDVERITTCRFVRFNRPFFCVIDRDSEVGCKGILFFGASEVPVLTIDPAEKEKFDILWRMFTLEMHSTDSMQSEMLHMMLRRLLILCTRLYKAQRRLSALADQEVEVVREFHFLVETHFRTLHAVADYAALLHRSPKTLANLFAGSGKRSPLKHIQERIMLEARRLIRYSDRPMKDIAQELGVEDVQTFSRFFKTQEGTSPTDFRAAGS
ncbi:MAG TPA: helix-turn-helix domain-containing protein, partial [Flavobacteriales bacterium]|nr:helix-turn-helix domain-containing protein [Flavobacteriales bacterium]